MARAVVREPTLDDVAELGSLHVRCWGETYVHILSPEALARMLPEDMTAMWARFVERAPKGNLAIAEVDGEIVGFSGCGTSREKDMPDATELWFIYLLAEHHGSGLGQQLLDAIQKPDVLWVAADNPRAQAFYRRNGLLPDGREQTEEFFGEPIAEIRMVRGALAPTGPTLH